MKASHSRSQALACALLTATALTGTHLPATAASSTLTDTSSPAPAASPCTPTGKEARVLYYQDSHEFTPKKRADGERGGISRLATVLKEQSNGEDSTHIVFGGDLAGGTLFGGFYKGVPFIEAMNRMGVDFAGFGQHEFDFGADHARNLVAQSNFTWISSNLTNTDGSPFVPTTNTVQNLGGVKVGYLSLTTGMSTTIAGAVITENDLVSSALKATQELQAQGAEVIVALGQLSAQDAQKVMDAAPLIDVMLREESSAAATGSVVEIPRSDKPSPRLILEAYGDYGNVYTVSITPTTCGQNITHRSTLVNADVAEDPEILPLQKSYVERMETALSEKVTSSSHLIERPEGGALIARSYRERTGTQLGWQNGGGVRSTIDTGDVTLRSLHSVLPFDNKVLAIEVNGAQLLTALEQGANSSPSGSGGYPRTSGFDYRYVPTAPEGQRIVEARLDDGSPIDPNVTYTLALTNYVYNGGNKVTAFSGARIISTEIISDVDALIAFARKHPVLPVSPLTGQQLDTLASPTSSPAPSATQTSSPQESPSTPLSTTHPTSDISGPGITSEPTHAASKKSASRTSRRLAHTGANTLIFAILGCGATGIGLALQRTRRRYR